MSASVKPSLQSGSRRVLEFVLAVVLGTCLAAAYIANFIHHILPAEVTNLTRALAYFVPVASVPLLIIGCWVWERRRR